MGNGAAVIVQYSRVSDDALAQVISTDLGLTWGPALDLNGLMP